MASPHWLLPPLHSPAASSKTGPCFGCGGTRQLAPASSLLCPVSQRDDWSAAPFCWPGPEDCRHLGARRQVAGIRQERAHCPLPTEPPGHLLSPCCMETQWRPRGQGSGGERSVPSSRSLHGAQQGQDCPGSSGLGEEVRGWDLLEEPGPQQRCGGPRGVTGGENGGEGKEHPRQRGHVC